MRIYAAIARRDDGLPPEHRLLVAVYRRAKADLQSQRNSYHHYTAAQFVQNFTDALLHSTEGVDYTEGGAGELVQVGR